MLFKRDLLRNIQPELNSDQTLLIIGPRQAGKTTLLHQIEELVKLGSEICYFLNLEDPEYLSLLNQSPKKLFTIFNLDLNSKNIILIDEVQYLDNPSNFLKYYFDQYQGKIKIIASGSSAFYLDKKFTDSLVGRKKLFTLLPLSFREFLGFKQEHDLKMANFNQLSLAQKDRLLPFYLEYITYGGYPRVVLSPLNQKLEVLKDLAYSYIKKDIYEAGIRSDEIFYKLFKILASQIGNLVNNTELASILGVSQRAIDNYLYIMQKSFHIGLIRPFYKNIRKELTKKPKIYFIDLGLRNFFKASFTPFYQRDDAGQLLENAVYRQLLNNYDQDQIRYWRTIDGKEIDFIIKDNQALEVKANLTRIRLKSYQKFMSKYPAIKMQFVTLKETLETQVKPVLQAWQV